MNNLIFLHGFLSSSNSRKARLTSEYLKVHRPDIQFHCPYLTPYPERSAGTLLSLIESLSGENIGLIGSSLGGFWANWLLTQCEAKAVMVNPSVRPFESLARVLDGPINNYDTGEPYRFTLEHLQQFHNYYQERPAAPNRTCVLLQSGDEVLDYREAERYYSDCLLIVEQGGDHGFVDYEQHLAAITEFLLP